MLLNHWSKFHITSYECSPWCPLSKLHKWFRSNEQGATRAPEKKSFKRHLLLNHWPKFKWFHRIVPLDTLYRNCTSGYTPLNKRVARAPDKKYLLMAFPPEPQVQIQNNFTGLFFMIPSSNIAQMFPVHWTGAAKALDKKCLKMTSFFEPLVQISYNFNWILSMISSFKIAKKGSALPNRRTTQIQIISQNRSSWYPLPKLRKWSAPLNKRAARALIRNTFKLHFLLNHWSKFKIISQHCSSWYLLPRLHKWFQSTEQRGC